MRTNRSKSFSHVLHHFIALAALAAWSQSFAQDLQLSVQLEKQVLMQGDVCNVDVSIDEASMSTLQLVPHSGIKASLRLEVRGAHGEMIPRHSRHSSDPILAIGRPWIINSNATKVTEVLNRWFPTDVSPGEYTVLCHLTTSGSTNTAGARLRIREANPEQLAALYDSLAAVVNDGGMPYSARYAAAKKLSYASSSSAVRALDSVLRGQALAEHKQEALSALIRIQNVEAARALAAFALDNEDVSDSLRAAAVRAVQDIATESDDPLIHEQTRRVTDAKVREEMRMRRNAAGPD